MANHLGIHGVGSLSEIFDGDAPMAPRGCMVKDLLMVELKNSTPVPHWRDLILFNEYFHGDNGAGLGASHQTGWIGLVAELIQQCMVTRNPKPIGK